MAAAPGNDPRGYVMAAAPGDDPRGYVVAGAAFMIQLVTFGIATSIGVYNIALLEYYKSSVAATSMIGAINIGLLLGGGPIASFLMRKLTYRKVAFLGSLLSSVGLLLSPFAPNIIYLDIFYGILTGLGFCLVYMPSHTLSGLHFDKHRSLVTGVVTSGSGLGGVLFPLLAHYLILEYGWRGSLLIMAAINMNNFVFAALLLPVAETSKKLDKVGNPNKLTEESSELKRMGRDTSRALSEYDADSVDQVKIINGSQELVQVQDTQRNLETNIDLPSEETIKMLHDHDGDQENKDNVNVAAEKEFKNCYVMCNFHFLVYFINNLFWNMGSSIVFVLGPEYFTDIGLSVQNSTIGLMCFNATITVGGALGGAIGNIQCINRMALYIFANFATGLFILFLAFPFVHNFLAICLDMVSLGLVFGILLGLLVIVTADILGVQSLGDGMGYLLLANGIGSTIGPPIGGWIKDVTGSYTIVFYLAGMITMVASVVMLISPIRERCLSKMKSKVPRAHRHGHVQNQDIQLL